MDPSKLKITPAPVKAEGVEKARAAIKENNITPDAKTRVLVTESGSPFAIIQLLDSDARMYGTHEVLAWIETNEKPYAMNQTYTEWFRQRVDKRLISAVSKEATKETSGLGFLQTQTADAKYIKSYADYIGQVPAPEAGRCKRCISEDSVVLSGIAGYYVVCFNCGARTAFYLSEGQAIAAWNSGALLNRAQKRRSRG